MVTLKELEGFLTIGPARQIPTSFTGLLTKLDEHRNDPKTQLAMIDYWIGMLLLTRSRLTTQG